MHLQFTVLLWNIQTKWEGTKRGYYKSVNFTASFVEVYVIASSCKSVTFFASFFLLMCWYESESFVFSQDEFQAVLLFLLLESKTVLCPNIWKSTFFWKIGLYNSKILLKKLYLLNVKNKLSTGYVVKMLCKKVDIKKHCELYYVQTKAS